MGRSANRFNILFDANVGPMGGRFQRIEDELARCRANLWREAAAMGAHPRLSQRDGVGARPSPFAQLERDMVDMVLKYVEAPYLPPVPRTVVPII